MPKRRSGVGLRTRLIALVLVPVILLAALTLTSVSQRRQRAADASAVLDRVEGIGRLVELTSTLLVARSPVEVEIRAQELGIDPEQALALLDLEPGDVGNIDLARDALLAIPVADRPFAVEELDRLATSVAAGASLEQLDMFQSMQLLVEVDWQEQVGALRAQIVGLGDTELASTAEDLIAASSAGSATANLLVGLADHWFSSLDDADRSERARLALGAQTQRFDAGIAQLRSSSDPDVLASARLIANLRDDGPFGDAIDDALAGRPPAPFVDGVDVGLVVATFTDSFSELQPLLALLQSRSDQLSTDAGALAEKLSREADLNVAAMLVLTLLLLVLTVAVIRSLGTPLERLIDAMRKVGEGDLSGEPLAPSGPSEIVDATVAFNDVLANLRMLDGKVQALAHADLDDPRVAEELPGPLGRELDASVEELATSIADRTDLQERLEHQATHDPLTGIQNRAGATAALRAALARAHRSGSTVAVAFLDLDGFKAVNDQHGHATGDRVLVEVGERLADEARAGDTCARIGGDEFIVIAENMHDAEDARSMGRRIAATLARPMRLGPDRTVTIGASVGIALTGDPTESPDALLHRADVAAYQAKRAGSGVELASPTTPDVDLRSPLS